jgi:hypothetical protein
MSQTKVEAPFVANNANFRNLIINGDMNISQRATSETGVTSSGYYNIDRWRTDNINAGTWTISQSTTVPTGQGFFNSQKFDCTTADGSLASADRLLCQQRIEDQFCTFLKKGTSSALSVTVSFWVRSNKTGTYICEIYDSQNSRHINKSYTIDSADTWEKKTIVFPGDTTGAFANDNGVGLMLGFWLAAGTDYTSGTLATAWQANDATDRAVGQVNLADSTSNEWYLTGVQLEAGDQATDFEFLPFDINLARCQRYCEVIADARSVGTGTLSSGDSDENIGAAGVLWTTRYGYVPVRFATKKRSNAPSLYITNDTNHFRIYNNTSYDDVSTMTNSGTSSHHALTLQLDNGATDWTAGHSAFIRLNNAAAYIMVIDEL